MRAQCYCCTYPRTYTDRISIKGIKTKHLLLKSYKNKAIIKCVLLSLPVSSQRNLFN